MDLSLNHAPIGQFVERPKTLQEWHKFQLAEAQVDAFHENGYVAGIQVLNDQQVGALCSKLEGLMNKPHSASHLFHEYHSNESQDSNTVLFHALARGERVLHFTMCRGDPPSWRLPRNCWVGRCASGTISFSVSRRTMAACSSNDP